MPLKIDGFSKQPVSDLGEVFHVIHSKIYGFALYIPHNSISLVLLMKILLFLFSLWLFFVNQSWPWLGDMLWELEIRVYWRPSDGYFTSVCLCRFSFKTKRNPRFFQTVSVRTIWTNRRKSYESEFYPHMQGICKMPIHTDSHLHPQHHQHTGEKLITFESKGMAQKSFQHILTLLHQLIVSEWLLVTRTQELQKLQFGKLLTLFK